MSRAERTRAAVIGSGFGGLAVAIRLQAAGMRTTLYEAHDQPGGRARVFRERGFSFDAGPTVITAPHCIEELFAAAGKRMSRLRRAAAGRAVLSPAVERRRSLRLRRGPRRTRSRRSARAIRRDVAGYLRFLEYSRAVFEQGYVELAANAVPERARHAQGRAAARAPARRSLGVSHGEPLHLDPHLREAFSFHTLLVGGNPFETSSIYTLIHYLERTWGVFYPRGGTGALVRALCALFSELGGELRLSLTGGAHRTRRHEPRRPSVHARGEHERFDLVVSNADLHHTYATSATRRAGARRAPPSE